MQDVKTNHLELFYDCVDESNNVLYEAFHKDYFELIEMTVKNILAGEILTDTDEETTLKLQTIYDRLADIDFQVEEVRKAMQAIILKGLNEMRLQNGATSPDTLGIFPAYLITKLSDRSDLKILDPLCGTGNLLHTVADHLDKNLTLFACDLDPMMTKLTSLVSDLLNLRVEIFLQDSLTLAMRDLDFIIFDMPNATSESTYFPYQAILHYKAMLRPNGAIIGIVGNDFFDHDDDQSFKKALLEDCSIIGLVELPDAMFVSKPKTIVVISKEKRDKKNCFMVKLPSFTDVKDFNESLLRIEAWFEKNYRSEEK